MAEESTKPFRPNLWGEIGVDSSEYEGENLLIAVGKNHDGTTVRWSCLWSARDCPVGSIPAGFFDLVLEQFNKAIYRQNRGK